MKKFCIILTSFFITTGLLAQVPEKMSYQAVVRNGDNQLVTNQAIGMQISILEGSSTGTPVYVETHATTTNGNGLVTLEIGSGLIVSGNFSAIDWAHGMYYIKAETDPEGNANYTITGTSQLLSVPYALHAKTADSVTKAISETQDLADVVAVSNAANGQIKQVTDPTDLQDAATKAYVDALKGTIYNELLDSLLGGIVLDVESNVYKTISIGAQIWMAENLKTTKYNDGNDIPLITNATDWANLTTPGFCWYDFKEDLNKQVYGAFYNFHVVNTENLCPQGWHVPDELEWATLIMYLGGVDVAGGSLKESGTTHWKSPNTGATNASRFTALPGGYLLYTGSFMNKTAVSYWWSSSMVNANAVRNYSIKFDEVNVNTGTVSPKNGHSVRCVKD